MNIEGMFCFSYLMTSSPLLCLQVTNDLMRDHRLAFLEPRPFIRWRTTQVTQHITPHHTTSGRLPPCSQSGLSLLLVNTYTSCPWDPPSSIISTLTSCNLSYRIASVCLPGDEFLFFKGLSRRTLRPLYIPHRPR